MNTPRAASPTPPAGTPIREALTAIREAHGIKETGNVEFDRLVREYPEAYWNNEVRKDFGLGEV